MDIFKIIKELEQSNKKYEEEIEKNKKLLNEIKNSEEYKLKLLEEAQGIVAKNRLMRKQEAIIYKELLNCRKIQENFIVCPQVAVRAFIENLEEKNNNFTSSNLYNQLYVDFLFLSKEETKPFAVLEFNGGEHYSKNDKTKEKLFRKVNIPCIWLYFENVEELASILCKNLQG